MISGELPSRREIRELVERTNEYLRSALDNGENIHQIQLDLHDEFLQLISQYTQSEQEYLRNVHREEVDAFNAHMDQVLAQLDHDLAIHNAQNELVRAEEDYEKAKTEVQNEEIAQWIGAGLFFVLIIGFLFFFIM